MPPHGDTTPDGDAVRLMAAADRPLLGEVPVVQAPLAGGPSTPELTAAVARAGGFGFLAAGYRSPEQLTGLIAATRERGAERFGVNLFIPSAPADPATVQRYGRHIQPASERLGVAPGEPVWDDDAFGDKLDIVASERVGTVSFTFGCPDSAVVDRLHRAGCRVAVTVTSGREARVAEGVGADLVVAQGTEAGGHQGSFLDLTPNLTPLSVLVDEVRAASTLPVVASGGIMTGSRAAEVLGQGAVAVQLGTAFLCAAEAGTSAVHRTALLEQTYAHTIVTRAFSGRFARGLANDFALRYGDSAPEAYPEVHHLTAPLRAAATAAGDPSIPNLWAGSGWRDVGPEPAGAVVRRIAAELR